MSPKFISFNSVHYYFFLRKMFRTIYEYFSQQIYNELIAHNHETRSNVNAKLALPRYSKSMCPNAFIFSGIKLWNKTPKDIKYSANLARLKKYHKRFILSSSDSPN